jgi:hypothetical protein
MQNDHTQLKLPNVKKALIQVSSTYEGRLVLRAMLADFGLRILAKAEDPYNTYFALGMQSAAFAIESALMECAGKNYSTLLEETKT